MQKLRGRTTKEIASRLHGEMSGPIAPKLFVLPYNRYKLDGENIWWLAPSSDNPAYAVGKFFCSDAEGHCEPGQMRCGLHVEKGIEDGAEDPSQKMLPSWEWHRFVLGMTSGRVSKAIGAAATAVGEPLRFDIVARLGDQEEEFSAETSDGSFAAVSVELSPAVKALHKLRGCTNVADLGALLTTEIRLAMRWGWIDLFISSGFKIVNSGPDDMMRCKKMLEQFEPWVQGGARK